MTNLEEMNSNPNPKPLSYLGAALVGLVLQGLFQLNMAGEFLASFILILGYTTMISVISFYGEKTDNKILLHFNEFWITLDQMIKDKMSTILSAGRI
jgi:hypothetical protein